MTPQTVSGSDSDVDRTDEPHLQPIPGEPADGEPSSVELAGVDAVADEFVREYRSGRRPSLDEFVARYPQLEADLRELIPALVVMEKLAPRQPSSHDRVIPERFGRYRILREIGRGGMGVVYEAIHEDLGRHVALKVLPHEFSLQPEFLERFRNECRTAATLQHPHIVPVYEVGETDGLHFYAMQFIRGFSLDRLRDIATDSGSASGVGRTTTTMTAARSVIGESLSRAGDTSPMLETGGVDLSGTDFTVDVEPPTESTTTLPHVHGRDFHNLVARIGRDSARALWYAHAQGVLHRDIKPSNL
ncbi:MAG: serine/threonine protein kinase, partial [Planctomycetaceae bacterium]|nr:serine/threonine protein kinase [Planctomycetaceae bacterium]